MYGIKLKKNDTIAVMITGSMPGANIAVLSACKAMGIYPIIISSLGASQWGANQADFTWLDMEAILYKNDLIPSRSIAASIGGRNDMGRLLSPAGRKILTDNIVKHNVLQINEKRLAEKYRLFQCQNWWLNENFLESLVRLKALYLGGDSPKFVRILAHRGEE